MQAGWTHALKAYLSIDASRAVAAGASWGGYAINWIQGHQQTYNFNFKALFCHDGVFDATYNGFSTDELYFFQQEWGGKPWEERAKKNNGNGNGKSGSGTGTGTGGGGGPTSGPSTPPASAPPPTSSSS